MSSLKTVTRLFTDQNTGVKGYAPTMLVFYLLDSSLVWQKLVYFQVSITSVNGFLFYSIVCYNANISSVWMVQA